MVNTYSASVGKEVRAHGLNVALSSSREGANSLEVLLGTPARRQGGEGNIDNLNRSHCNESVMGMDPGRVWEEQLGFFACLFFSAPVGRPPIKSRMAPVMLHAMFCAQLPRILSSTHRN